MAEPAYAAQEVVDRVWATAREHQLGLHRAYFVPPDTRVATYVVLSAATLGACAGAVATFVNGSIAGGVTLTVVAVLLGLLICLFVSGRSSNRTKRLDLFEAGLVYSRDHGTPLVVRYHTTSVYREITNYIGSVAGTTHSVKLTAVDGDEFTLSHHDFGQPSVWGNVIQQDVTTAQLPAATDALAAGTTVWFGPIWISRTEVGAKRNSVPWSQIRDIRVYNGSLRITVDGKFFALTDTPVAKIPNFHVLFHLAQQLRQENSPR